MSDFIVLDYILKSITYGLMGLWVLGMGTLLYGLISGEADVANASFGVFDYI